MVVILCAAEIDLGSRYIYENNIIYVPSLCFTTGKFRIILCLCVMLTSLRVFFAQIFLIPPPAFFLSGSHLCILWVPIF